MKVKDVAIDFPEKKEVIKYEDGSIQNIDDYGFNQALEEIGELEVKGLDREKVLECISKLMKDNEESQRKEIEEKGLWESELKFFTIYDLADAIIQAEKEGRLR